MHGSSLNDVGVNQDLMQSLTFFNPSVNQQIFTESLVFAIYCARHYGGCTIQEEWKCYSLPFGSLQRGR